MSCNSDMGNMATSGQYLDDVDFNNDKNNDSIRDDYKIDEIDAFNE